MGNSSVKIKECEFDINSLKYRNVIQSMSYIYSREGLAAFGRGIYPRMTINVPSTAISWGTYEFVKGFLINNEE